MSISRPHYQSLNGSKRVATNRMASQILPPLPQHDDIIKFVFESWSKVNRELSEQTFSAAGHKPSVTYYEEREPNPLLKATMPTAVKAGETPGKEVYCFFMRRTHPKNFEPFDLEAWWGKRLVQNIQAASSSTS